MSNNVEITNLTLRIDAGQNVDANELDYLTRQLRNDLLELDSMKSVERAKGASVPKGAMAGELTILNELIVQLAVTGISAGVSSMLFLLWRRLVRTAEEGTVITILKGGKKIEIRADMSEDDLPGLGDTVKAWIEHTN